MFCFFRNVVAWRINNCQFAKMKQPSLVISKRFEYCCHVVRSFAENSRWISSFNSFIRDQFVGFENSGTIRWFLGDSLDSLICELLVGFENSGTIRWFVGNSLESRIREYSLTRALFVGFANSWKIRWFVGNSLDSLIREQFVRFENSGTIRWFVGNSFHSFDSLFNEWFVAADPTNEMIRKKKRQFASLCSLPHTFPTYALSVYLKN